MTKNILILSASARSKGNSSLLAQEFVRGAQEGKATCEIINLAKSNLACCLGCGACKSNAGTCIQNDDLESIRNKMTNADVIVLASPIYFYSMAGQMKTLLDRTYGFYPELAGKTFCFIISCGAPSADYAETMIASLRGYTRCVPDSSEGGIVLGMGAMGIGEVTGTAATLEAFALGERMAQNN